MMINKIYLGAAYDAMRVLGYRAEQFFIDVKPILYTGIIVGHAFTTFGEVVSETEDYSALDNIRIEMYQVFKDIYKHDLPPIVLLQANDSIVAHSGDITSLIYKKLGAIGFITDGKIRDVDLIENMDFSVFCNGVNPIDAINYWALTKYNCPIVINNVLINPGDLIIGGRDGVIRVPHSVLEEFNKEVKMVLEKEETVRKRILDSDNFDFSYLVHKYGRW